MEVRVIPAYEDWDAMHSKKHKARGTVVNTANGNRAYQEEKGAAHPADGFPVRVDLRKNELKLFIPT